MNALAKKTFSSFLRFEIFLGFLLFGPAWSFRYGEAWLYLLLFTGPGIWATLYFLKHDPALIERRLEAGPRAEKEASQKVIMAVAGVLMVAMYLLPGFDHRLHWSSVPLWAVLLADGLVVVGMVVVFFVMKQNSFAASTIQVEGKQKVISTGLYGWVRHPMYAGSVLWFLPTSIALGSWWGVIPGVLVCVTVAVRLIYEERFLRRNLAGYDEYCRKVRWRLLPCVW